MKRNHIYVMILAGMLTTIAYVLPFFTGQIPQIGGMLCPMHIPVIICGFLCGPFWGMVVGVVVPLLRSITLGMPILFPMAVCMAFELGTYGLVAGIFYNMFPKKKVYVYVTLLLAMVIGRIIWGLAMYICVGLNGGSFGMSAFIAGAVTNALPGIILQIVLIPVLIMALNNINEVVKNE